jgi:Flp pilus assembly protein TadB
MIWLIELALVLLLVGGGWTMMNKGRHTDKREALTLRRVDAYIETIRRERRNGELMDMSDTELRDLLHSGARSLRAAEQKKGWTLLGVSAGTLVAATVMASVEGWVGFGVTAVVGAIVTYGVNEFLNRRMRAPLERRGIDVERLTVE